MLKSREFTKDGGMAKSVVWLPQLRSAVRCCGLSFIIMKTDIANSVGIDAPDVRYVYHHCISKSMEG